MGAENGRYYELTIAAGAGPSYLNGVEIGEVAKYVDNINVMTFDFAGGWSPSTEHHTNLYGGNFSVDASIQLYLNSGIPADKLVIAAAFYGHVWTDVENAGSDGLGQPAKGSPDTPTYTDILAKYNAQTGYTRYWDETAHAPYLFDGSTFISYDDPQSIARRPNTFSTADSQGRCSGNTAKMRREVCWPRFRTGSKAFLMKRMKRRFPASRL
ncbi:Chitinase A1 precursor [Paenibacillus sp. P1XP2]|nr:Chitinase A1 precursor [Paenibacillus sp. P1XP2]